MTTLDLSTLRPWQADRVALVDNLASALSQAKRLESQENEPDQLLNALTSLQYAMHRLSQQADSVQQRWWKVFTALDLLPPEED
jgi:hypothetical protein